MRFPKLALALCAAVLFSAADARNPHGYPVVSGGGGGGATLVFNYPNFSGPPGDIHLGSQSDAAFSGPVVNLTQATTHVAGSAWYDTQVNIQSFTATFSFQSATSGSWGTTFVIQNTNASNMSYNAGNGAYGVNASSDANGNGYAAGSGQSPIVTSIGVVFDQSAYNSASGDNAYLGTNPSTIGLFMNGGPNFDSSHFGFSPAEGLSSYGINFTSGDVFSGTIIYDGSYLDLTLVDTSTNATVRKIWPLNLPLVVAANSAWVGMVAGTPNSAIQSMNSLAFWEGYNTRLSAPTLSVPGGSYGSTQTVTLSAQAGASIYYTTNGQIPTANSTLYTGAITVSQNTYLQAVAVESNYTPSYPATANYLISASHTINFASGFASPNGLITYNGTAALNGSNVQLTGTTTGNSVGSAWYSAPVAINGNWSTTFTLNFGASPGANGMAFVIQNYLPASQDNVGSLTSNTSWTGNLVVSGGPNAMGFSQGSLGYGGLSGGGPGILSSAAVVFDIYHSGTGLYTNGGTPPSGETSPSPVSFTANHPLQVVISYNAGTTTLSESITDTVNSDNYTTSYTVNLPSVIGSNNAYVGFTGSTGGLTANQQITEWTM